MHVDIDMLVEHIQTDDPRDEYNLSMLHLAGAMNLDVPTPHGVDSIGQVRFGRRSTRVLHQGHKICAATTMSVTVIAGPLDYVGLEVRDLRTHP